MKNTANFHWLSLMSFSYITENENKVKTAMLNLLPESFRDEASFDRQVMHGQFNDRIIKLELRYKKRKEVNEIIDFFKGKLSSLEKKGLDYDFKSQWDNENRIWHLRMNKQKAFNEVIQIDKGGDIIKWLLKFQIYDTKNEEAEGIAREMLINSEVLDKGK